MKSKALTTEKAIAILTSRKAIVAEKKTNDVINEDKSILLFKIDNKRKYALPYEQIERVIPFKEVTYIPGANYIFLGALYHDTEVWPVLSCHRLFKIQDTSENISFFILCKKDKYHLALSVNEILGQINIESSENFTHLANENRESKTYIRGVFQTDIAIINLEAIFEILTLKI
jgi:chemotaxis signal transduction protein